MPQVSKDLACTIFKQLLEPVEDNIPAIPNGKQTGKQAGQVDDSAASRAEAAQTQARYSSDDTPTMTELLGGGS